MPYEVLVWCDHPCHEELLSNGRKRNSKSGRRPTHPEGKTRISERMAESINKHQKSIVNGVFGKLTKGDYLCPFCLRKERSRYTGGPSVSIDIDEQESLELQLLIHDGVGEVNSPMDHDSIGMQQNDIKRKLNQVFESVDVKIVDDL